MGRRRFDFKLVFLPFFDAYAILLASPTVTRWTFKAYSFRVSVSIVLYKHWTELMLATPLISDATKYPGSASILCLLCLTMVIECVTQTGSAVHER